MYRYQFHLFSAFAQFDVLRLFSDSLWTLFASGWEFACQNQSFAFHAPVTSVGLVEGLLKPNADGAMKKCARILLDGAAILKLSLSPEARALLESFALRDN
jgi:hypothetical protein